MLKSSKKAVAVSACLLGEACRYDGKRAEADLTGCFEGRRVLAVCPEVMGGLPTPRVPCEIQGGDGADVLDGKARVTDREGVDRTGAFVSGAEKALALLRAQGVREAVLKSRSPSCGSGRIYAGDFSGEMKDGDGVAAALFKKWGIRVTDEQSYLHEKEMNPDEETV